MVVESRDREAAEGQTARHQEIAKRNQYFFNLAAKLNLAPSELNGYLVKHSITNAAHEKLLSDAAAAAAGFQHDMFSLPLAAYLLPSTLTPSGVSVFLYNL